MEAKLCRRRGGRQASRRGGPTSWLHRSVVSTLPPSTSHILTEASALALAIRLPDWSIFTVVIESV